MIRGVLKAGKIHLLEPIPEGWAEGRTLKVEAEDPTPSSEGIDEWAADCDRLAASIDSEDAERMTRAITEHRASAKAAMRREMGLP